MIISPALRDAFTLPHIYHHDGWWEFKSVAATHLNMLASQYVDRMNYPGDYYALMGAQRTLALLESMKSIDADGIAARVLEKEFRRLGIGGET